MNKDAVQNERQPRSSATVQPEMTFSSVSKSLIKTADTSGIDTGTADITVGVFSPFFTLPSKIFPTTYLGLPKFHHHHNLKEEIRVAEMNPLNCKNSSPERMQCFKESPVVSPHNSKSDSALDLTRDSIYDTSTRILLMTIRWAKNFPSFASLCFNDQVILLEESWSELFVLSALQWGIHLDTNPLLSSVETALPKRSNEHRKLLYIFQKVASRLKILTVDLAEFACLKAIILFKSDTSRLKDSYQVEVLQDHAQLMLAHHIKTQHIDFTLRFGRLLLLLPLLRQIQSEDVESIFFCNTVGSLSVEKLLWNMFKS